MFALPPRPEGVFVTSSSNYRGLFKRGSNTYDRDGHAYLAITESLMHDRVENFAIGLAEVQSTILNAINATEAFANDLPPWSALLEPAISLPTNVKHSLDNS